MKKNIFMAALATTLLATSCADNEVAEIVIPDSQKEMISFSLSDGASQTRAGLHQSATTKVVMRIMSEDNATPANKKYVRTVATASAQQTGSDNSIFSTISFQDLYKCYWDDAHGRNSHLSVYAVAVPGKNDGSKVEESSLTAGNGSSSASWGDISTNTINWEVTSGETPQTDATKDAEDLVYSRNIRENGTDGRYVWDYNKTPQGYPENTGYTTHSNGRLQFTQADGAASTDAGHFDKGHLVFTHALSRINLTLVSGTGFKDTDDNEASHDFVLSDAGIIFKDMNVQADLDLTEGSWGTKTTGNVVAKPAITSITYESNLKAAYNCMIQVIPDYEFGETSTTNVISFTIDGNTYYVDQKMIFDALKNATGVTMADNKIKMEQQKCYNITIKINKTAIDNVTATLEDWTYVSATNKDIYNSYINLSISSATGGCDNIDLYRLGDGDGNIYTDLTTPPADLKEFYTWKGDYTDQATIQKRDGATTGDGKYTTNWFFEDNKTFYHFRTVKQGTTINTTPEKDNFKIQSGAQDDNHDFHWGAPMKSSATFKYNISGTNLTEGYGENIYKAIGSTKDEIKITELHMMSNINIVLETTTTSNKVNLTGAKVYLTRFVKEGTVDMGSGLVTPDPNSIATTDVEITAPSSSDYWTTTNVKTKAFTYSVVPQALTRGTSDGDYIGVIIVTSDNNQYYIIRDLSQIYASSTTQGGTSVSDPNQPTASDSSTDAEKQAAYIQYWYPNHNYTYTFKITKKGIDSITATLQEWSEVNAAEKDIDLEN